MIPLAQPTYCGPYIARDEWKMPPQNGCGQKNADPIAKFGGNICALMAHGLRLKPALATLEVLAIVVFP
jgi:hypothetical protein